MIYDTKNYAYFSLYMTIKLPVLCDAWAEYKEFKSISLENLGNPTISSPKSNAPIIISCKKQEKIYKFVTHLLSLFVIHFSQDGTRYFSIQ